MIALIVLVASLMAWLMTRLMGGNEMVWRDFLVSKLISNLAALLITPLLTRQAVISPPLVALSPMSKLLVARMIAID